MIIVSLDSSQKAENFLLLLKGYLDGEFARLYTD